MQSQTTPKNKGFLGSLATGINTFVSEVEKGISKAYDDLNKSWSNANDSRFRKEFGFPQEEILIGEYWAQCISGTSVHSCAIYVSNNFLSFVIDLPTSKGTVMIPWREVSDIQRAVALRCGRSPPVVQPVLDATVRADAIQVYTRDLKLHQFFCLLHLEKAYHAMVHGWRMSQSVPAVQPQPLSQTVHPPTQAVQPYVYNPTATAIPPVNQMYPGVTPATSNRSQLYPISQAPMPASNPWNTQQYPTVLYPTPYPLAPQNQAASGQSQQSSTPSGITNQSSLL